MEVFLQGVTMSALEIVSNIFATLVGFGLAIAVLLGEPLKGPSRRGSLIFASGMLVTLVALLVNRILDGPRGIWWWLSVVGIGVGLVAAVVWIFLASKHWPKEQEQPQEPRRFRPVALLLLPLSFSLFLLAYLVSAPFAQVALALLAFVVGLASTHLAWVKEKAN